MLTRPAGLAASALAATYLLVMFPAVTLAAAMRPAMLAETLAAVEMPVAGVTPEAVMVAAAETVAVAVSVAMRKGATRLIQRQSRWRLDADALRSSLYRRPIKWWPIAAGKSRPRHHCPGLVRL